MSARASRNISSFSGKSKVSSGSDGFPPNMAGQVRFLNRGSVLGFEAAREAVDSARIELSDYSKGAQVSIHSFGGPYKGRI